MAFNYLESKRVVSFCSYGKINADDIHVYVGIA